MNRFSARSALRFLGLAAIVACASPPPLATPNCPNPGAQVATTGSPSLVATAHSTASGAEPGFLRLFAETSGFRRGAPERITPTSDGAALFLQSGPKDRKLALYEMRLDTGAVTELASADSVLAEPETLTTEEKARRERMRITSSGITSFELDATTMHVLFMLSGKLFVLDRSPSKDARAAHTKPRAYAMPTPALDPHFSPDGKRIGYVRNNDVFVVDVASGRETQVTRGGTAEHPHGVAEFVAQEELARTRGFWFSPASDAILWADVDNAKVEHWKIADPARPDAEPVRFAYPRPGKPNATVRLALQKLAPGAQATWVSWDSAAMPYLANVSWQKNAPLTLYVLDRRQTTARLVAVDESNGKTTTLVEEKDAAWVNVDKTVPQWFDDGSQFVWSSERSGESRLELHKRDGALVAEVTPDAAPKYRSLTAFDRAGRVAWYETGTDPAHAAIARVELGKPGSARVIAADENGSVRMSARVDAHDVFAITRASSDNMPTHAVWNPEKSIASAVLVPSKALAPPFVPRAEIVRLGNDAYEVAVVRPRKFDASRKYPLIDAAYGGPHATVVAANASMHMRSQWMADELDAIVVAIDAKGTPLRDRAWERALVGKFGSVPLEGHVAAIAELGRRYREMDVTRVGVYGWSFGGYFSALAVLRAPDTYKVGVAGAPVTDWRDYDSCYTERYLGLLETSAEAYDAASLLTYAADPKGVKRPLLVVHGTADDNVYFVHSLKLIQALQRAERPFEFLPLVGVTHMLYEPEMTERTWRTMAGYLKAHL